MFKLVGGLILICLAVTLGYTARESGSFAGVVLNSIRSENYAKNIVTLLEFNLVPFNGHRAISGAFRYNQAIMDMQLQLTLAFEKPDKTRLQIMDLMIDACKFLNGTYSKLKIPQLILNELRKQKALPKHCPFEANKTFSFENYEFQMPKFPLPNLKFVCTLTFYSGPNRQKIIYVALKGATKRFSS